MSAVLRASGPDFDVDALVADGRWRSAKVFRRDEPVLPKTQPGGRRHAESGLNVVVSEAGFHEFAAQVEDAIRFLNDRAGDVRTLATFPGVTSVVLDFGIERRDVAAQTDQFPAALVRRAGECGVALALSHYLAHGDVSCEMAQKP